MMKITCVTGFIIMSCCFTSVFLNDVDQTFKGLFTNNEIFHGKVKISIGKENDDPDLIKKTLAQIKKRIEQFDYSVKEINKNSYEITINNTDDTTALKRLISASTVIEFLELFSIVDLQDGFMVLEKELNHVSEKEENLRKNNLRPLSEIIHFSLPYQINGRTMFPAEIGIVKRKDTSYLNQLFTEKKIKMKFPSDAKFAYGNYDDKPLLRDSILKIYALKTVEKSLNFFPKGNQISDASVEADKLTKKPTIVFSFNKQGSDAWYLMTRQNIGKPIAIIVNGNVFNAPFVEQPIEGGKSRITGNFTKKGGLHVIDLIKSGELELQVKITESNFSSSK